MNFMLISWRKANIPICCLPNLPLMPSKVMFPFFMSLLWTKIFNYIMKNIWSTYYTWCSSEMEPATEGQVLWPVWGCNPAENSSSEGLQPTSNLWSHTLSIIANRRNTRSFSHCDCNWEKIYRHSPLCSSFHQLWVC